MINHQLQGSLHKVKAHRSWLKYFFHASLLTLIMPVLFNSAVLSESVEKSDRSYTDVLSDGLEDFYQTRWDRANSHFEELILKNPDDPRGYFFKAMIPFWEYFFVEQSELKADKFFEISEKAIEVAERKLNDNPDEMMLISLLSGLYGYRSLVASGENRVRRALSDGRTGYGYTKRLLEHNEERAEVHIGKGMFNYMVGNVPGGLKWLASLFGLRGDKETGFEELEKAAEADNYIHVDAKMILVYLHEKEGSYEKSIDYLRELVGDFEQNVIFRFKLAQTLENLGKPEEAMEEYEILVAQKNTHLPLLTERSIQNLDKLGYYDKISYSKE